MQALGPSEAQSSSRSKQRLQESSDTDGEDDEIIFLSHCAGNAPQRPGLASHVSSSPHPARKRVKAEALADSPRWDQALAHPQVLSQSYKAIAGSSHPTTAHTSLAPIGTLRNKPARHIRSTSNPTSTSETETEHSEDEQPRQSTSSSLHADTTTWESDAAMAARLAQEEQDELQRREKQLKDDEVYVRAMVQAEDLAERRLQQQRAARTHPSDSKIAFQVTMDADGKTIAGDEDADNAAHLELVKRDFNAGNAFGMKLKTVTYFVNMELIKRFEEAKYALAVKGHDATEKTMFHGTASANIQPILENGFRIGGTGGHAILNGAVLGIGVYLATSPMTSLAYCAGHTKMFACRVALGRTTPTKMSTQPAPIAENAYDSYMSNGIAVVRVSDCVLPSYCVEFETTGPNYYRGVALPQAGTFLGKRQRKAMNKQQKRDRAPHRSAAVRPNPPEQQLDKASKKRGRLDDRFDDDEEKTNEALAQFLQDAADR